MNSSECSNNNNMWLLMQQIHDMLGKVNYIESASSRPSTQGDEQYLKYLGCPESALSELRLPHKRFDHNVSPGQFLLYTDVENLSSSYKLMQCLSLCNPANECFALTLSATSCTVMLSDFIFTDLSRDDIIYTNVGSILRFKIPEGTPTHRDIAKLKRGKVIFKEDDDNENRIVVFKGINVEFGMANCVEFKPEVQSIRVSIRTCKLLSIGNTEALGMTVMDPPSRLVDDGIYEDPKAEVANTCYCTFMATFQREISTGDCQLSIKRYFCNDPNNQEKQRWTVYCGRIDINPVDIAQKHSFKPKTKIEWTDDRYAAERNTDTLIEYSELKRSDGKHSHVFINIFVILQHWARHDAEKGESADELLWFPDKTYSPYDSFCQPPFPSAYDTNLRTYDFTITQCLRNWVYGIFQFADVNTVDTDDECVKQTAIEELTCELLAADVTELNTILQNSDDFPSPIVAGTDMEMKSKFGEYTQRAGLIIKNAFMQAFASLQENPFDINDMGTLNATAFASLITKLHLALPRLTFPSLKKSAAKALVGGFFDKESDEYITLSGLEKHSIISPRTLRAGDLLLIYNSDGVSVAYFHSVEWMSRGKSIGLELMHFNAEVRKEFRKLNSTEKETLKLKGGKSNDYMNTVLRRHLEYMDHEFQYFIPIVRYTSKPEGSLEEEWYVRDIFNVYTVSLNKIDPFDGYVYDVHTPDEPERQ